MTTYTRSERNKSGRVYFGHPQLPKIRLRSEENTEAFHQRKEKDEHRRQHIDRWIWGGEITRGI